MKDTYQRKQEEEGYSPIENGLGLELQLQGRSDYERQYKIGPYSADFFFPKEKVVLEVDGLAYHSSVDQMNHDRKRDKYMNEKGYAVLRVTGSIALKNPSGILNIGKYLIKPKTYFIDSEEDLKKIWTVLGEIQELTMKLKDGYHKVEEVI